MGCFWAWRGRTGGVLFCIVRNVLFLCVAVEQYEMARASRLRCIVLNVLLFYEFFIYRPKWVLERGERVALAEPRKRILGSVIFPKKHRTIEHSFVFKDLGVEQLCRTLRTFRTMHFLRGTLPHCAVLFAWAFALFPWALPLFLWNWSGTGQIRTGQADCQGSPVPPRIADAIRRGS